MITPLRSIALRAIARPAGKLSARDSQQPVLRQRYSTAKDAVKSSSSIPWALTAIIFTSVGTYFALQPRESAHHEDHSSDHEPHEDSDESKFVSEKASDLKDAASDKKDDVKRKLSEDKEHHKEGTVALSKSLIKGERSGESVKNHGIASEKNEHKVRQGKFCDDEFDNHVTVHSNNPGNDFEKIKKDKRE